MKKVYLLVLMSLLVKVSAQLTEEAQRDVHIKSEQSRHLKMVDFNVNPNTLNYDLKYQRLELTLDPAQRFVSGTVTSHFVPNQPITSIYFDLAKALTVSEVRYRGNSLPFTQLTTKEVKITLPATLPAATLDSLSIKYSGTPANTGSAADAFSTTTQGGTPVLFTLSEPYGAQEWFPTKQSLNDKIEKVDIVINTPSQYSVASNGKLLSEKLIAGNRKVTFWQTNYPIPAYLIALGITNYIKLNDTMGTPPFPFINYLYPATANNTTTMNNIAWTKTVMDVFEQYFGPYPYRNEKYGHMEFSWGGGMEHATMSSMGSWGRGIIAHELAHQWFGDKVTCGAWNDVWLNEGFAAFGEHLANEKLLMNESQFMNYLSNEISTITSAPGGSVYVADSNLSSINTIFSSRLSYSKGAYVLRMLKWILGDATFYDAVKAYHSTPALAYGYAKTADLKNALLSSTGKDFTEFFNDWIYGEGYPTYKIRWNQTADQKLRFVVNQTQSSSTVSFFEMPLPIKVNGTGGQVAYLSLDNSANNQKFEELINFPVASVQFNYANQIIQRNSTVTKDTSILSVDTLDNTGVQLFPNPAKEEVFLSGIKNGAFQLLNAEGKLVRSGQYEKSKSIDVRSLPPGVYVLIINMQKLKFLKQ